MDEHIFSHIELEDTYVEQVFSHYRQCFITSKKYRLLLASNNLISPADRNHIEIGVCSRTLGLQLPGSRTLEGGAIRGKLHQKGLLTRFGGDVNAGLKPRLFAAYSNRQISPRKYIYSLRQK